MYFVIGPIVAAPDWGYLYALALMVASLVIYVPLIKWQWRVPGMGKGERDREEKREGEKRERETG